MSRLEHTVVDLSSVQSKQALHQTLQNALAFPDWYGQNWDAFWDAITGLVEMPARLEFLGWASFESRLPNEAYHLRSSLEEMSATYPNRAAEVLYR